MTYWQGVLSRLSVPGIALMVIGAWLSLDADKLCALLWKEKGKQAAVPMKIAGLVLAALGALILLDIIPI